MEFTGLGTDARLEARDCCEFTGYRAAFVDCQVIALRWSFHHDRIRGQLLPIRFEPGAVWNRIIV